MAAEKKTSNRDETLIKILERLSDDIRNQQMQLDDIASKQHDLSVSLERAGLQYNSRHDVTNAAIERSQESIQRYRSDLLSIVNEQDRTNLIMTDLNKKQAAIAFTQDNISKSLTDMIKLLETQIKDIHSANEHSTRQGESLTRDISGVDRSVAKLHMDFEKRTGDMRKESQQQLEKVRMDVERRLLSLDKIEAALEVLLIRTEPPEKKPFFVIRIGRKLRLLFKNIRIRFKERRDNK